MTEFEHGPGTKVDLNSLVKAASESLKAFEPWNHVSSEHPALTDIITKIQASGTAYHKALDTSITTAKVGYAFSKDAEDLCEYLLDSNISVVDLQEYIAEMKDKAREAHQGATHMLQEFRLVRQSLFDVTKQIPTEVANAENEANSTRLQKASLEESRDAYRRTGQAVMSMVLAVTKTTTASPALFLLPILVVADAVQEITYIREIQQKDREIMRSVDAIEKLRIAGQSLESLVNHVSSFAEWWDEMDTILGNLKDKVDRLGGVKIPKIRMKGIMKDWEETKDKYAQYKTDIGKLQDYYPSSLPRSNLAEMSGLCGSRLFLGF